MFLGINAFAHDASASLVDPEGRILAAVEEERFTRRKREARFPIEAIRACLRIVGATPGDLHSVAYPWHPAALLLHRTVGSDMLRYRVGLHAWQGNVRRIGTALSVGRALRQEARIDGARVRYFRHHLAHAASAYYPSPFEEAAYLTIDGRGEAESITWGIGKGARLHQRGHVWFPNSIGKLYSATCRFLGFDRAEKDGTVMALAGCGEPRFVAEFEKIIRFSPGAGLGGLKLDTRYFDLQDVALPSQRLERLLGGKARSQDEPIGRFHQDVAASLQVITERAILHLFNELHRQTGLSDVVFAGGVALNSVANGMILENTPFRRIFIQPAAHDGGLSLGGALLLAHEGRTSKGPSAMSSAALGPEYSTTDIQDALVRCQTSVDVRTSSHIAKHVARLIAAGKIVALFRGRMEFGPRALGHRSILADPRDPSIQQRLNSIKGREQFRPFAASILQEYAHEWLCRAAESPFMLMVDHFNEDVRSRVPGVQHVDFSVRVQTVRRQMDPFFHGVISRFRQLTGIPLLVNTSLNVRGEPLACTPDDAIRVLESGGVDVLAIADHLVSRSEAVGSLSAAALGREMASVS